jgi:hypothetical protein
MLMNSEPTFPGIGISRNATILPRPFPCGALKQRNIEDVGRDLHDVPYPKSASCGKHWSSEDMVRRFAPSDETVDIVLGWLIASGIGEEGIALGRSKGWIQVNIAMDEAEQVTNTEHNAYTHVSGKRAEILVESRGWVSLRGIPSKGGTQKPT